MSGGQVASIFPFSCLGPDSVAAGDVVKRHARPSLILPSREPLNPLKRALAEDRATLGYLVSMPSVQLVQALARTGVDWLMIDTEHAPIGIESVAAMIAATGGTPATPLVRVPGVGADLVKPVLDCGALGVVFPQVATAVGRRGHGACGALRAGGAARLRADLRGPALGAVQPRLPEGGECRGARTSC